MDARLDRINAAFDALDTNSNGYLEADDFDRLGHRIVQALDVAESSPKAQALTASCDRDDDGFVQHADFVRGMRAVGFPAENTEALFRAFDPQGTGQVARTEWRTAIEEYFLSGGSHAIGDTLV